MASLTVGVCISGQDSDQTDPKVEADETDASVNYVTTAEFESEVLKSEIPVLVDFTATWCVPCRIVDPIIESLMPEMDGRAKVFKLDIDESPEIYGQLGVNGVPHVLFFKNGKEQERISSPQEREIYVEYLNALIDGTSAMGVTVKLLGQDEFRRHYILTKEVNVIGTTMDRYPELLTEEFENGQTPLSLILNSPSVRQNELIELTLAQNVSVSTNDLVGLGRCQEFMEAVEKDPDALNRMDPDGNSPLMTAMARSYRLEEDCVSLVLDLGPDLSGNGSSGSITRSVILLNDDELLTRFLKLGWDPEPRDTSGRNALHWAALYGYLGNVRVLLDFGVDIKTKTSDGETAAQIVQRALDRRLQLLERNASELDEIYLKEIEENVKEMEGLVALLEGSSVSIED
ncbi:MAG: thioredoxin domain-containing protein [Gammaproteobacteria bacterium]|nr:thioredoxin domain-containing protein [Gammaproteobacteria bacterium]